MRIVVAPDKFAGTLSAVEAAAAIAEGWARHAPGDVIEQVPMSDGGPGFVEVLHAALGGDLLGVTVTNPYGEEVPATVLRVGDTAYVESAQAVGLHLTPREERQPERGTSRGVGELLLAAVGGGARRIVVGLGGSATNDGGAGVLAALGATATGAELDAGPAALDGITAIDLAPAREALAGVELVAASDVDNPLAGLLGATKIYGPQKGLPEERLLVVDGWLEQLGIAADRRTAAAKGAGAAGGIGFALLLLGAVREPGVEMVAAAVGLADRIRGADLVVTGEGAFDFSSRSGKVPYGVAQLCAEGVVPCVALAGQVLIGCPRDAHPRRRVGVLRGRPGGGGARVRRPRRLPGPAGRAHRAHLVPLTRPRPGPDGSPGFRPDRGETWPWNNPACGRIDPARTPPIPPGAQTMTEQVQHTHETRTDGINLSDGAASKVKALLEQEGRDDLALRIAVQPGGCSGLRYQLFFDERSLDGDQVTDFGGVAVVVDRMSVPYLSGATIDFVDTIEKQGFTIDNPNATGSCACGDSFH